MSPRGGDCASNLTTKSYKIILLRVFFMNTLMICAGTLAVLLCLLWRLNALYLINRKLSFASNSHPTFGKYPVQFIACIYVDAASSSVMLLQVNKFGIKSNTIRR